MEKSNNNAGLTKLQSIWWEVNIAPQSVLHGAEWLDFIFPDVGCP